MRHELSNHAGARGVLMFLHIPKTGGTSVLHALQAALGASAVRIATSPEAAEKYLAVDYDNDPIAAKVRVLSAHSKLSQFPRGRHFTLLREPRERILSLFLYFKREPTISPNLDADTDFAGFWSYMMKSAPTEVSNTHCHYLADGTFANSIEALDRQIEGWATTDRVNDLSKALLMDLGCSVGDLLKANSAPLSSGRDDWQDGKRPQDYKSLLEHVPSQIRRDLLASNEEDMRLYDEALKRGGFQWRAN